MRTHFGSPEITVASFISLLLSADMIVRTIGTVVDFAEVVRGEPHHRRKLFRISTLPHFRDRAEKLSLVKV